MRELIIEWRHYDKEGVTCSRCNATGIAVKEVVAQLVQELAGHGISVRLIETLLEAEQLPQSNMLLFNGVLLEDILQHATATESGCRSCACLTGTEASCRAVAYQGGLYEEIPAELIRRAAMIALGIGA